MSNFAIKVEDLSKAYQLGEIGTGTVSRDLERWWAKIRDKEDPFLRIGETNDRSVKGTSDVVWSLKDLNFEIEQGEAVGIIGRNGAGKSTLLKILSRVTSPTSGSVKIKGRIASLLEVGTGFHPELTGRENIFLNGAILGMRKAEIKKHFDAIVDFSGVERYVDTPVKRYSSGMYVRLAFAVAAHLESEILIVDEVLAVGDAEFQKKCLGKMGEVSKGEGRTVLFVSHNMDSVLTLTDSTIVLNSGNAIFKGNTIEGINTYLKLNKKNEFTLDPQKRTRDIYFHSIKIEKDILSFNESLNFKIRITSRINIKDATLGFGIMNKYDAYVANILLKKAFDITEGINEFNILISNLNLVPSEYRSVFAISRNETNEIYDTVIGTPSFSLLDDGKDTFLFSKWETGSWGFHYIKDIQICRI